MPETTSMRLTWDNLGEHFYETGVDRGVVYPMVNNAYPAGAAWNGLINANFKPKGAEPTALYANNKKYLNLMSLEEEDFDIEAYTYPAEFAECDGSKQIVAGVRVRHQVRKPFGFSCRVMIGNDTVGTDLGYKIHILYGATASPSEQSNATINDNPEAKTMTWSCTTTPVDIPVPGFKASSHIEIDSRDLDAEHLTALENVLYGTDTTAARLPMPAELFELIGYVPETNTEDEGT